MLDSNSLTEKIDSKVLQLQNYRQIFMDINTPEKLRSYRHDLINFFFDLEREIKVYSQMINTLSIENTNLKEKSEFFDKDIRDLHFENSNIKEKLYKQENTVFELKNSISFYNTQVNKKQNEIEKLNKELFDIKPKYQDTILFTTQVLEKKFKF